MPSVIAPSASSSSAPFPVTTTPEADTATEPPARTSTEPPAACASSAIGDEDALAIRRGSTGALPLATTPALPPCIDNDTVPAIRSAAPAPACPMMEPEAVSSRRARAASALRRTSPPSRRSPAVSRRLAAPSSDPASDPALPCRSVRSGKAAVPNFAPRPVAVSSVMFAPLRIAVSLLRDTPRRDDSASPASALIGAPSTTSPWAPPASSSAVAPAP